MNKEQDKEQEIAVVTGGSKGIGKAICVELAKNGYYVAINYMGDKDGGKTDPYSG